MKIFILNSALLRCGVCRLTHLQWPIRRSLTKRDDIVENEPLNIEKEFSMATSMGKQAVYSSTIDSVTSRPRTPNDQYTVLTDLQIKNIKKQNSPFFHTVEANTRTLPLDKLPREGGRYYRDRFTQVTNEHLIRGVSSSQPFGWVDHQWNRHPPEEYNTCRGRASVRWGPNKSGERTRSHFFGESIDRYTNIDMYRRPPTNYPGRVVMDCGRPADGYFAQKYPSHTTWFGSSVPLNRTQILQDVHKKTKAEYEEIRNAELTARMARNGQWPEYSEYTDKFLLGSKTAPKLTGLQEKKRHIEMSLEAC